MVVDRRKIMMLSLKVLVFLVMLGCCIAETNVDGSAFKVWRQKQKTTQKNHVKLRFKTFHATGLILYVEGANKKDFLSIELYRGKIRVAANYGRGTENSLRPIAGFYDMYLGKDLADDKWHTVEFIRNIRESILFIDRGRGKMEKSTFVKSPPTYTELSVSMVTFGGYYSFATSELSTKKSLSRKGITACFSEATFSQYWPEDNAKEINFLVSNSRMQTIGKFQTGRCSVSTPPYRPMFFPSSAVHIALLQNYTIQSMKVQLKFRTVVSAQTLTNYTTKGTGERIQLRLDRKGRVTLGVDVDSNMQMIETAKTGYHDGEWHDVSFLLDNQQTEGGAYTARFTVDGKTRLSMLSENFKFDGYVNIGFGFTGCMRDIKINDDVLERVRVSKNANEYFPLADIGVLYNQCSLKDYCNPNPCQNGGKCNQTEDNIVCDCRDTLYEGSTCHRARFNYTCAGVRKSGERRSDVYFIDFDGMGPMEPVRTLCDLGNTVESTTTQINNTQYADRPVLTSTGVNSVELNYAASITQMRELVMNSQYCEQLIKYTCKGTPMFQSPEGPPKVNWMGGDDILHYYWGGSQGQRGYCACGITDSCANRDKYCNCDSLSDQTLKDEGNLTIKEHLPVRKVNFQSVLNSGEISSEALLLVGHLRCSGFGSRHIAATFRKPWSYLTVDHPDQPFDNIFAGGISFDFKTSVAYNYMVMAHAHGPFSGDYLKVMIWSQTMIRVHLNFGFGDIKQDVDISSIGRTLDDNQWHEFDVMFNLKELNVTLDGVRRIQGLPLQDDPVQFNVDDKPVYIGGSNHDKHGFVGCIRSLYVNGRIHDIRTIATGQDDYGVYPGCGSACVILNRPCNYGSCIDEYDSFKCNCSVSPFDGKFCQNETFPKKFTGNNIVYDLKQANLSEPVATAVMVVGFKTTEENVALLQLEGTNDRHFSLALQNGYLTLLYSFKNKITKAGDTLIDTETEILRIRSRKLNNNKHNIARVKFTTGEIFLYVPNYELMTGANVSNRMIDPRNPLQGEAKDMFGNLTKFSVGQIIKRKFDRDMPTGYTGCMSGAKLVFHPLPTAMRRYRKSVEVDMFKLIQGKKSGEQNPSGSYPTAGLKCGNSLPTPGTLPTVGPARQFFTRSPGLDNSVTVTTLDTANHIIVMVVIVVIVLVLLGFLLLLYYFINTSHLEYNRLRDHEKPGPGSSQPMQSYQPPPQSSMPATSYQPQQKSYGGGASGGDEQDFFL